MSWIVAVSRPAFAISTRAMRVKIPRFTPYQNSAGTQLGQPRYRDPGRNADSRPSPNPRPGWHSVDRLPGHLAQGARARVRARGRRDRRTRGRAVNARAEPQLRFRGQHRDGEFWIVRHRSRDAEPNRYVGIAAHPSAPPPADNDPALARAWFAATRPDRSRDAIADAIREARHENRRPTRARRAAARCRIRCGRPQ